MALNANEMYFNLIFLQQNVLNNWKIISVSIMSVGNVMPTRVRFVYALDLWRTHAGHILMKEN